MSRQCSNYTYSSSPDSSPKPKGAQSGSQIIEFRICHVYMRNIRHWPGFLKQYFLWRSIQSGHRTREPYVTHRRHEIVWSPWRLLLVHELYLCAHLSSLLTLPLCPSLTRPTARRPARERYCVRKTYFRPADHGNSFPWPWTPFREPRFT